jgi:hypothetical protein
LKRIWFALTRSSINPLRLMDTPSPEIEPGSRANSRPLVLNSQCKLPLAAQPTSRRDFL